MTYIFITGQYLPKPGATGLCMHKLALCLKESGMNVFTVCVGDFNETCVIDDIPVHKVRAPHFLRFDDKTPFHVFFSRMMKFYHLKDYPLRSITLKRKIMKEVQKIIFAHDDDYTVVASFTPIEAVAALIDIRKRTNCKSLKLVYYSADALSNEQGDSGILPRSIREKKGIKWEKKIFSVCDLIFIMDCHSSHYYSEVFKDFHKKMRTTNFPLMNPKFYKMHTRSEEERIEIVYLGTLYKDLRNPAPICSLLNSITNVNYHATFMGGGDCSAIMNEMSHKSNGRITYTGMVPYAIAEQKIVEADILLSIGNDSSPMMPSKIYEYISTGKPILHYYSWDNDPCLPVLRKYENALLVNENTSTNEVSSFIQKNEQLDFKWIANQFKDAFPSYTIKQL